MKFEKEIDGKKMFAEIGKVAWQANGSCLFGIGETVILATAVMGKKQAETDYFPLIVDYEERFYAAGKIKGSRFIKRETRPPDEAILAARAIDRGLRPLFDERLRYPVQIITIVLAIDKENDPDLAALYAASLALGLSDIPFKGPISGIRVGRINGQFIFNPIYEEREHSDLDLLISVKEGRVMMIEANAAEISEEDFEKAITLGLERAVKIEDFFKEIIKAAGKEKMKIDLSKEDELKSEAGKIISPIAQKVLFEKPLISKEERIAAFSKIKEEAEKKLLKENISKEKREKILELTDKIIHQEINREILENGKRIDGRGPEKLRQINALAGVLPRVHGSALFSRGETQVLSVVTLGSPEMEQYLDTMEESGRKRFMHHYNFLPFCSGEVASLRYTGRRETGHSYLVERGLREVLPSQESFPYTIRVVSEVLSSNGSTSMASVCASSLSLMDAGVPITNAVAGVAIGLASEEGKQDFRKYKVFADLQDLEDGEGGMDFKIVGTKKGVVAAQMDTKTLGLTPAVIHESLILAAEKRSEVLKTMEQIILKPRPELSTYAPRLLTLKIDTKKIRDLIGPGGQNINRIIAETGVEIKVEQDGTVTVTSVDEKKLKQAVNSIKVITGSFSIGQVFEAKITRLVEFGAFAEIAPGKEGLIHISELSKKFVRKPEGVVKVGDKVKVKLIKIDQLGRLNLSIKQV